MYNLYTHFTTLHMFSTAFPQSSEPRSIDYSSRQFVAWRVMQSACSWVSAFYFTMESLDTSIIIPSSDVLKLPAIFNKHVLTKLIIIIEKG